MADALIIGIAGGIAAGKSRVARMFVECGAESIDADREAHEALESDEVKKALLEWMGPQVIGADGRVERSRVAETVFSDPGSLKRLEALVHPRVRATIEKKVRAFRTRPSAPLLVLDVPLLLESGGLSEVCDKVIFVEADRETRTRRAAARDWSEEELERREGFQLDLTEKKRRADHTIRTAGSLDETRRQVEACFRELVGAAPGPISAS